MSRPADCLLLLGGNVGDRLAKLRFAAAALANLPGSRLLAKSRVYETSPVGPSSRPYLNAVIRLRTPLSQIGLLVECKRTESEAGRRPAERWTKRPLDIDLLDYSGIRLNGPFLTLPHPLISSRSFVLAPLSDVSPSYRLPGGLTAARRLAALSPSPSELRLYPRGI